MIFSLKNFHRNSPSGWLPPDRATHTSPYSLEKIVGEGEGEEGAGEEGEKGAGEGENGNADARCQDREVYRNHGYWGNARGE